MLKQENLFFLKVKLALGYDKTTMKSVVSFVKIIYIKDSRLRLWGSGGGETT